MPNPTDILLDPNELKVISIFEKRLECIFFCETKVIINPNRGEHLDLIIEIHPYFSLTELLDLFRLHDYSKHWNVLNSIILNFKNEVIALGGQLSCEFDIQEISIFLRNTSITISSVSKNSIVEEIIFIIYSIIMHFDHYTAIGSVPSTIHIPIFEDLNVKEILNKSNTVNSHFLDSPYSLYWGLYFDHLEEPMVYSLIRSCIISGDIDLIQD